jgi:hypothetical protein
MYLLFITHRHFANSFLFPRGLRFLTARRSIVSSFNVLAVLISSSSCYIDYDLRKEATVIVIYKRNFFFLLSPDGRRFVELSKEFCFQGND